MSDDQKPSLGRIVLYRPVPDPRLSPTDQRHSQQQLAAIVISVAPDFEYVNLHVFGLDYPYIERFVEQGDGEGQWQWPPRAQGKDEA